MAKDHTFIFGTLPLRRERARGGANNVCCHVPPVGIVFVGLFDSVEVNNFTLCDTCPLLFYRVLDCSVSSAYVSYYSAREGGTTKPNVSFSFPLSVVSPAARIDPKVVEAAIGRSASLRQIYKQTENIYCISNALHCICYLALVSDM